MGRPYSGLHVRYSDNTPEKAMNGIFRPRWHIVFSSGNQANSARLKARWLVFLVWTTLKASLQQGFSSQKCSFFYKNRYWIPNILVDVQWKYRYSLTFLIQPIEVFYVMHWAIGSVEIGVKNNVEIALIITELCCIPKLVRGWQLRSFRSHLSIFI